MKANDFNKLPLDAPKGSLTNHEINMERMKKDQEAKQ